MKKLTASLMACFLLGTAAFAAGITDPFFMPSQGIVMSDTALAGSNNDLVMGKSAKLFETITFGAADNLSIGVGIGYGHIHHGGTGFIDPVVNARYRILNELDSPFFLDFKAFVSPDFFDSPYNNENGAAQGTNDFGAEGIIGSTQWANNFTVGGVVSLGYNSHSDLVRSGTIWGLRGFAKYYFDDINSFELGLNLKAYSGFNDSFTGYGFNFNYARDIISDKFAAVPFIDIEAHNKDISTSVNYGVNLRYIF